jgi:hypothetical protein
MCYVFSFFVSSYNVHCICYGSICIFVFNIRIWLAHSELLLLFLIACICSLYPMWNILLACPIHFSGQSRTYIWYIPRLLYLSLRGCCFSMFSVVFLILNTIFICMSLNTFVIFPVSFPLYVKVTHFVFRCCWLTSVFCFCEAGCFLFVL